MKDIHHLFIDELKDILSSEEQIVKALPKMVAGAQSPELKNAFKSHLQETKGQIERLKKVFKIMGIKDQPKFCKATKGLIDECQEALEEYDRSPVRDAALISKGQRIEHYEIAAYGTVRTFANELNLDEVADLLQETLDEEAAADKKLTKIAVGGLISSGINQEAFLEEDEEEEDDQAKRSRSKTASHKTQMPSSNGRQISSAKRAQVSSAKTKPAIASKRIATKKK